MPASLSSYRKIEDFFIRFAEDNRFPLRLFFIGLIARILFTLLHVKIYLISDMIGYNEAAMSMLMDGELRVKGVVSGVRPPSYPFFLAVIYYLLGHSFLIVRLVQAALGAFTAVLAFKIGERMFSRSTGALAGLIYALYPASWAFSDLLLTECLFTFLIMLSIWFFMIIPRMKSPWVVFWAGFFAAAATLARTVYAPFPFFIFLVIIVLKFRDAKLISRYALVVIIFMLVLFPWMLRNYCNLGAFTLNPKSGGDFFMYNHSGVYYIIQNYEDTSYQGKYDTKEWGEVRKGRVGKEMAVKWIKNNPELFIFKGFRMLMNIWGFDRDYLWYYFAGYYGHDPRWMLLIIAMMMGLPFIVLAPLAFAGFFISKPLEENRLIPTLVIVCLHILTFIVYGFSRHRFPFVAIVFIWSAYALLNWDKVRQALRGDSGLWRKWAILFSWGFLGLSWLLEIAVDVGSIIGMRFQYPGF